MNEFELVKAMMEFVERGATADAAKLGDTAPAGVTTWQVGKCYLIRTVTHIQTGRLVAVGDKELVLEDAAWIADTGRFSGALASCDFSEVEPFPEGQVIVGRGAVIDAVQIHTLPRTQK